MLQKMRERLQGIIATIIIVLICSTFALWGVQYYIQSHGDIGVIAKVNGIKISESKIRTEYERMKQDLMQRFGRDYVISQDMQDKMKEQVRQDLITKTAVTQEAIKFGFRASNAQMTAVLQHLPAFQVNGAFSAERFQMILSGMLYTEQEFFDSLQQAIIANQIKNGLAFSSFATKNEAEDLLKLSQETRDIGYTIIPSATFKNQVKLTDDDINAYYKQHQSDYQIPEKVSISYLELNIADLQKKISVTEDEIKQYYENHIDLYSHPKSWQISRIYMPISAAADKKELDAATTKIAELQAKAKADQDFSKVDEKFGKVLWLTKDQMPNEIVSQIENAKAGEVVGPFQGGNGLWVVKVLKVKESETMSLTSVKDKVRKALMQDNLEQLFSKQSEHLSDLSYTNSDTLEPAAKDLGLTIKTTELFTAQGGKEGITANPRIVKAAFSDEVIRQNYNSSLLELAPSDVVVIRVKDHQPASTKPLAEVRNDIEAKLQAQKIKDLASQLGQKLVEEIKGAKNPAQIVAKYKFTWKNESQVARSEKKQNNQITEAAFNLPDPEGLGPETIGFALDNGDFAIVQVSQVHLGDISKVPATQLQLFTKETASGLGQIDFDFYIKSLVNKAKIKQF